MNRKNLKSFLFIFAFFLPASLFAKVYIPEQTAWVMDSANIIDKNTKSELNSYLESVNRQTGVQIAVFTVKSLEKVAGTDATIEEYATDVFEKWGLGQKKEDNGVLLLVCLDEKKVRIEVGYGLEGVLTDTKCGLIIRNFIAPDFKNASYSEGIKTGVNLIAGYATGNEEIKKYANEVIYLPKVHPLLLSAVEIIPLQIFAYYISLHKGCDIDKPRNLAKSVTVE